MVNTSDVMRVYNRLKQASKEFPTVVTMERLNKALSIAQTEGMDPKYFTNLESCTCPDQSHRSWVICKHRMAYMMLHANEFAQAVFEERILSHASQSD